MTDTQPPAPFRSTHGALSSRIARASASRIPAPHPQTETPLAKAQTRVPPPVDLEVIFKGGDLRTCASCGASNPSSGFACIVCGQSLTGPLVYEIVGSSTPILEITLQPGQVVFASTDALAWMTDTVQMDTQIETNPFVLVGRVASGMAPLVVQFSAPAQEGIVAFGARVPGSIIPVDLDEPGESYVMQAGTFLAAQPTVTVTGFANLYVGTTLFGGEGFVLQRLSGVGVAFAQIDGEAVRYELAPQQTLLVDPGRIALFESSVSFSTRLVRGIRNLVFGDNMVLAELRGPGQVWLQTLPFPNLAAAVAKRMPRRTSG